jgi:tetratricopeptide (TPR) repeat protein
MPSVARFPAVPVSALLTVGLLVQALASANPRAQTEAAKEPEPGFMLAVGPVEAPGVDIRPYFIAAAAVLRHSWPSKIQANLVTRGDKGIVFVRAVILRNGLLQQGSPILEIPSQMAKLNDASLATISASAPFDPLPQNYQGEKLELRIVFRYAYLPDAPFKERYDSAQRAVANQNYTSAAQLLETLVAQDPDYTNAWNYLGWVYNKLHKYDKAEDSLKKAIEVNPRDVFAYNNLGQAYAYQKKYDQAILQYLKQLEINKNDHYANANLGRVYLELKQYDKAIPALKSGSTADPKDPAVFYNLGRAYAKNNQMDDAKEAFKKSVDLEPVPMRFNNVAYQMAVLNVDLPTAQHYAETGLGVLVSKMRGVSLEQIGADDSRMTAWLSYLWATLGWTLFEEGRASEAEKYIKSAWLLRSNGEIGYELGRVYEAQGRRDEAVRTYELSLSASEPNPEARQRLAALLGGDGEIDHRIDERRSQLTDIRTISIPNTHDADGVAEFWILLSPGPRVLGTKFIAGDEVLRPFTKELETAAYPDSFPEATEVRLLRRGRLACIRGANTPCRLLMASAETVRTEE